MNSITILESYTNSYSRLANLVRGNRVSYALKYGYDFVSLNGVETREWYWHNLTAIVRAIKERVTNTEWIVWMDVDTIIMNNMVQMRMFVDGVSKERCFVASWFNTVGKRSFLTDNAMVTSCSDGVINSIHTGVIFVRNCYKSAVVLEEVILDKRFEGMTDTLSLGAWDEYALGLYYITYPDFAKLFSFVPLENICVVQEDLDIFDNTRAKLRQMGQSIANIPRKYREGDFILHAMGRTTYDPEAPLRKYEILEKYLNIIQPDKKQ